MIRKATASDIDGVELGYLSHLLHEQTHTAYTVFQMGVYPTRKTAEDALAGEGLYVLEEQGEICASLIMNTKQPREYQKITWPSGAKSEDVFVIHLLVVKPSKARRGFGRQMIQFAKEEAKRRGFRAVRLDTGKQNTPAIALYQKMGFVLAGSTKMQVGGAIAHDEHLFLEAAL